MPVPAGGQAVTALCVRRNNPIIQSWRVKAGSDLLSGAATFAVEKVFLAEVTPASPKDNDIALVKLRSPVHDSGEPGQALLGQESPVSPDGTDLWAGRAMPGVAALHGHRALEQGVGCPAGGCPQPVRAPSL